MRRGGVAVNTSQGWVQLGLPMESRLDAIQMFFKNGGQPGKTPSDKLGHYMPLHYVPVKGYTTFTTGYHAVDFTRYPYFWPLLQQAGFNFYLPTPGDAGKVSAFLKEAFQGRNPQKLTDSVRDEHASNEEGIPDLGTETQRFANKASEDFSRVTHFENDEITIGDGSVVVKQAQENADAHTIGFEKSFFFHGCDRHHPAIGASHDSRLVVGRSPFGIAKEEQQISNTYNRRRRATPKQTPAPRPKDLPPPSRCATGRKQPLPLWGKKISQFCPSCWRTCWWLFSALSIGKTRESQGSQYPCKLCVCNDVSKNMQPEITRKTHARRFIWQSAPCIRNRKSEIRNAY